MTSNAAFSSLASAASLDERPRSFPNGAAFATPEIGFSAVESPESFIFTSKTRATTRRTRTRKSSRDNRFLGGLAATSKRE